MQHFSRTFSSNYLWIVGLSVIPFIMLIFFFRFLKIFNTNLPDYTARSLYRIGLEISMKNGNPSITRFFWTTARNMYPLSGHLWVELASLHKYSFHDNAAARQILEACTQSYVQYYGYPAYQCMQVLDQFDELSSPGTLQQNVMKGL